jgi:hypothetical protein
MRVVLHVNRIYNIAMLRKAGGRSCGTARQLRKKSQFSDSDDDGEVFAIGLPGLHLFVRRHKAL